MGCEWLKLIFLSTLNRLNLDFQSIHRISPVLFAYYSRDHSSIGMFYSTFLKWNLISLKWNK